MVDVSAELSELSELDELTGPAVERVLAAAGWDGERRNPAKEWATTWSRGDASAWIQGDGPVEVEFTLWFREVEDERPDPETYLEGLYEEGVAELPAVVAQLESGPLGARLEEADEELAAAEDFIDGTAWTIGDKVLLAGVTQSDTDTPVQLVVVLRERASEEDDEGEWL